MAQTLKEQIAALTERVEKLETQLAELKASRGYAPRHADDDMVVVTCVKCKTKYEKTFADAKGFRICEACTNKQS